MVKGEWSGVIVCVRVPVSIVKMISTPLLLQLQESLWPLMRLYSAGQGLKVLWWAWREGGREGWRNGFLSGLGQLLQEAEIHREATYYYRLMQQQENSLFDNLLGINLFSQRHCYMIIIFVEILLNFLVYSSPFLHKYVFVKSKPNLYFDNSCLSSIFTFLCKTKMKL